MTGEKDDAKAKLLKDLRQRLGRRGLSDAEKKSIRKQLNSVEDPSDSRLDNNNRKPEKSVPELTPRQRAMELRERIKFIAEREGAYKAAWIKYYNYDESEVAGLMGTILEHLGNAQIASESMIGIETPTDDLVHNLEEAVETVDTVVMPLLVQVESLLRKEEKDTDTEVDIGDPMQVLDALQASCDPKEWAPIVKKAGTKKVLGSEAAIDTLTNLINGYKDTWAALDTDGIKGASYSGLRELANLRMGIVQAVADSGEVLLKVCCRPDTDFYNYIKKLASQSCGSRDVQNFASWWAKNSGSTG